MKQTKLRRLAGSKRNKRWYKDYFHGNNHSNYVGMDPNLGPTIVSVLEEKPIGNRGFSVRIISRTKYVCAVFFLLCSALTVTFARTHARKKSMVRVSNPSSS